MQTPTRIQRLPETQVKGDGLEDSTRRGSPTKPAGAAIDHRFAGAGGCGRFGAVGLVRFYPPAAIKLQHPRRCRRGRWNFLTIFWNGDRSRNSSAARLVVNAMPTSMNHFSKPRAAAHSQKSFLDMNQTTRHSKTHLRNGDIERAHRGGRLIHEVSLLLADGSELLQTQFPVRYRFGSGHFGRGYLAQLNGFLVESPISWFESRQTWGLSPGFEGPNQLPFGRSIPEFCLFCHSGHFERSTVSDMRMRVIEPSIGCERCHGPGKAHLDQQAASHANNAVADGHGIVNPRRLTRKLAEAICHQCHLQGDVRVPARGRRAADFHPGEPLEKYRQEYAVRKPRAEMQVVGHVGQLAQSACYRASDALKCTTCHDPHTPIAPENRADHYRTVCLACHDDEACKLGFAERTDQRQNDCAACHMPSRPTEMMRIAFTHHQIGKHPLQEEPIPAAGDDDLLIPLFDMAALSEGDRQRSRALAWEDHFVGSGASGDMPALRRETGRRAEQLLKILPADYVDGAVEIALARLYYVSGRMTEAENAARRALKFVDLPTEPRSGQRPSWATPVSSNSDFRRRRATWPNCRSFEEIPRIGTFSV